ncbi:sucrase ferredoxin, partial [Corynebacterium heidelbergense]
SPTRAELPGTVCSTPTTEPLPGTAKTGKTVVALEHHRGWGRDILDGEALGPELSARIKTHLAHHSAELHFIRRPGRAGQRHDNNNPTLSLYVAATSTSQPTLHRLHIHHPEELLGIDLSHPGLHPGATQIHHPIMLICTHGKRDRCCAMYGRPVAAQLAATFPPDHVWEASHTKGHRFAPSMLLLPANYSYGRLDAPAAAVALNLAERGDLYLPGNRGRGCYDPAGQVAEIEVAQLIVENGEVARCAGLSVTACEPTPADHANVAPHAGPSASTTASGPATVPGLVARIVTDTATGRQWRVLLTRDTLTRVVTSCGDVPGSQASWRARDVRRCTPLREPLGSST